MSDAGLLAAVDETTALCGEMFFTHYWVSTGGGQYATLLGAFLDAQAPGHPAEWTGSLTSGPHGRRERAPGEGDLGPQPFRRGPSRARGGTRPRLRGGVPGAARRAAGRRGDWAAFAREYEAFIDDLGFRGQRETDPSCATWDESPNFVLSSLQAGLAAGDDRDPHLLEERWAAERAALELEVEAALPAEACAEFRELATMAQTLTRGREGELGACLPQLPPARARAGTAARGARRPRRARGCLVPADRGAARGRRRSARGGGRAGCRRHSQAGVRCTACVRAAGDLLPSRGGVAAGAERGGGRDRVHGHGCEPRGRPVDARVWCSAPTLPPRRPCLPGEILVAPFTDAPWTPLFIPPAAGVVVETGGALSHAATVAREYGIPAVVGIHNATALIANGTLLSIDGTAGTVTIEAG